MARQFFALWLIVASFVCRSLIGQNVLAPEAGVLVLRNGQVIEGQMTRAGDFYVVTQGEGSELQMPAVDVELFCASLTEAYDFKVRHLSGTDGKPHLKLAEWCLRHKLHDQCAAQLAAAERIDPASADLKHLQKRLELAIEAPPAIQPAASPLATVNAAELDQKIQSLPKGSVEKFGAIVQPILLNRCGANQCHGPNAKSEYRLLRPPGGQIVSRRFTQRNLYATLNHLDSANPELSPLLVMPQRRHGNSLSAVFDKHSEKQLAELTAWVKLAVGATSDSAPRSSVPPTIAPMDATLSQPAAVVPSSNEVRKTSGSGLPEAQGVGVRAMRPPFDPPAAARPKSPLPFVPRDAYDPEIFNRRYHAGK